MWNQETPVEPVSRCLNATVILAELRRDTRPDWFRRKLDLIIRKFDISKIHVIGANDENQYSST